MRELFVICVVISLSIGIATIFSESYWLHLIEVSNFEVDKIEVERQKTYIPISLSPFTEFINRNITRARKEEYDNAN